MIRIAGINLPDEKRIEIALTYVFGIGPSTSRKLLKLLEIDMTTRTKDLSAEDANRLRDEIEKKYKVEGELKHEVKMNIKRLKEIGSYRGSRHQKGLPVNGQRTKTNSRTVRGNVRRTMGSGRRSESKT
ncbi:MAG: 30S ribosomal protein S13 [Candidatus Moranbacteria bacterium]|jgi:small subunit ribosomal protein S13|nr:MAG: 30S ribosomal protein S13 [Parcubacteria group bacterium GW2011_GWC1_36_108]MDD5463939.1 30S ribosomal protein S13 [Candidatus Moranbacteria bacterium]NTW27158.1 30S ribosomal protein S13 [Candidatus Moranbacteria bacterium]HBI34495.1 30S ribosomal protein S13 [Candidatus Moranbacteria bacterium]HBT45425.1 30S ribosomal protein S13 [Candidatus Moranbacteria bacterium]